MYSQHNDEAIIDGFFGKDYVGRFLDIGAFDGVSMSNTRALVLRGWQGVMVEASPWAFTTLYVNYKNNRNVTLIQAAVTGSGSGIRTFWPDTTQHKYGSTLDETWAHKSHIDGARPYLVNAIAIHDLLQFFTDPIDFVSIDTEGEDFNIILGTMGWSNVRLLCVETSTAANREHELVRYLGVCGFKPYGSTPTNIYFSR